MRQRVGAAAQQSSRRRAQFLSGVAKLLDNKQPKSVSMPKWWRRCESTKRVYSPSNSNNKRSKRPSTRRHAHDRDVRRCPSPSAIHKQPLPPPPRRHCHHRVMELLPLPQQQQTPPSPPHDPLHDLDLRHGRGSISRPRHHRRHSLSAAVFMAPPTHSAILQSPRISSGLTTR